VIWFLVTCGPSTQEIEGAGPCAWNQAYQERDWAQADSLAALGCDWVEFDNMDWAQDDESREATGFGVSAEEGAAYSEAVCQLTHNAGMKCMSKSTTYSDSDSYDSDSYDSDSYDSDSYDSDSYDGGTFESFPRDMDWWEHSELQELQELLDAGKLGLVIHYQEWGCEWTADHYRSSYDASLSFLREDRRLNAYCRL
jgi:cysteinyl-tRNA synthetase